jgi:predicted nucleic acid-binding protein
MPSITESRIPKIFLDSSVIIAGIFRDEGGSGAILYAIELGLAQGYISKQVIEEVRRNLQAKGAMETVKKFELLLKMPSLHKINDPAKSDIYEASRFVPPKDAPILAAAQLAKVDYLITLDIKDFRQLLGGKDSFKMQVMTPRAFLEIFS